MRATAPEVIVQAKMAADNPGRKVQPNSWELFIAGERVCPLCSCCLWFAVGWLFTVILFVKLFAEGTDIFNFEQEAVTSDLIVQNYYAFLAARGKEEGCGDEAHEDKEVCNEDDRCEFSLGKCKKKDICPSLPLKTRESFLMYSGSPAWVAIIYEAENDGNILDDEILGYIDKFENKLLTDVGGAQTTKGIASSWDQDWCKMAYPAGSIDESEGKCGSVSSLLNPFSMNAAGMEAVKRQVQQGYSYAGPLSCMCSEQDALCAICNTDGSVKPASSWPSAVMTCVQSQTSGASSSTSPSASANASAMCATQSTSGMSIAELQVLLAGLCQTKPTCQWAPPGASQICASTAFYRPTDTTGLLTGAEKEAMLAKMCDDGDTNWRSLRSQLLPLEFDCGSKRTAFGRTQFFAGGDGEDDDAGAAFESEYVSGPSGWYASEQKLEAEIEQESGGKLRIMLFSAATLRSQYLNILMVDGFLSIASLVMVWAYMWWTLESCFLASVAMFEIVFSLPVTMSVWTVFLQQQISFFQMLTIYMILGIGADDAFIFYDAWLQARFAGEQVMSHWTSRFAWAYRRSFWAMAVTTTTTCGSFLIGALSPLPQVRDFCIFAAGVVFVDWLFCITLFASAVVVHDRYLSSDRQKGTCFGPGCCCGACRVVGARCCKISWPPADAPPEKRKMERFSEGPLFNFLARFRIGFVLMWAVIVAAMLISAGVGLRTAEKANPIGRESIDAIRGSEVLLNHFSMLGVPTTSMAWGIDGEEPIEEWGPTHSSNVANLSPAFAVSLASPEGQLELLDLCRAADKGNDAQATRCDTRSCLILGRSFEGRCTAKDSVLKTTGVYIPDDMLCTNGRYCFMEEFARFWAYRVEGAACASKTTSDSCTSTIGCLWDGLINACYSSRTEYDYTGLPASEFIAHLGSVEWSAYKETREQVLQANGRSFDVSEERRLTGVRLNSAKTAISFAWISYNATYPRENSLEQANEWHERWDNFHDQYAPDIGGIQTTELYLFMVTQREMVKAAVMGVMLSLFVAFVVMVIATGNWWVSLLGLVNISAISAVFLGLMPLIGWSLGENECIFLIAVVGLSVDYTVHLLHVYNHSAEETREGRARHALSEMGISVTNSAITTLLAALILFGCGFYFFLQFGAFIFLVIGFSILMSISFLIPLVLMLGPQGKQGRLPSIRERFSPRIVPDKE